MVSESIWRRFDKLSVTNQLPTLGVLCLTVNPLQSIAQEPSLKVNLMARVEEHRCDREAVRKQICSEHYFYDEKIDFRRN